jgi:hypothetical protein
MPLHDSAYWTDRLRQTLTRYREPLLREMATRLIKPRSRWPVEELIDRCVAFAGNPVQIDRRLKELPLVGRRLLALIAHSRQPQWRVGNLLEMLVAVGHVADVAPILELLEGGLIYPVLPSTFATLPRFEEWLARSGGIDPVVFAHPAVAARALGESFDFPALQTVAVATPGAVREADGLEWPLRLTALWQQVAAGTLRRAQNGEFFKRDLDRLRQDALLSAPPADSLTEVVDPSRLATALAEWEGILEEEQGEVRAATLPASWDGGLAATLESLFAGLFHVHSWNPIDGGIAGEATQGNPFPSAHLLLLLLLGRQPAEAWCAVPELEEWLFAHHPYWSGEEMRPSRRRPWVSAFVLGLAYDLRLVQTTRTAENNWAVRLSPLGRWLLGLAAQPAVDPAHAQSLLVQPNLEIIAYRQGLTPGLIVRLGLFAAWKNLGAACTLQLGPETVYRALERGQTFETILQTLDQHGTRATPAPVIESLRTWADKRERISVYGSACLLEFNHADDLNEAVTRGLPAVRLTERLALVVDEEGIDYRHFRLTGTRDYSLPPDQCVTVEPDGVRLTVDPARSDLLLETELPRFAEQVLGSQMSTRRQYRLTPTTLAAASAGGMTLQALEEWFLQRTGQALPPAARLLFTGAESATPVLQHFLVLRVATPEMADGLMQWPETRLLIQERLGPTALAIAEEHKTALLQKLRELDIPLAE